MKADDILKKHEDANEMHFHEVDRKWIIEAMEEYASLRQPTVVGSTDLGEEYYDDEYYENQPHENCPKCGRHYDSIDFEYQSCSKCGWDEAEQKWGVAREPSDEDYENGDADILTGRWW